jgi:hypothetical protein
VVAEKACNLGLYSVRQQRSRAIAQNLCQRIAESPWLGKLDHIILGHGVSLLWWRSGGFEHPHDTPPYPFTPSPTFAHSSDRVRGELGAVIGNDHFGFAALLDGSSARGRLSLDDVRGLAD